MSYWLTVGPQNALGIILLICSAMAGIWKNFHCNSNLVKEEKTQFMNGTSLMNQLNLHKLNLHMWIKQSSHPEEKPPFLWFQIMHAFLAAGLCLRRGIPSWARDTGECLFQDDTWNLQLLFVLLLILKLIGTHFKKETCFLINWGKLLLKKKTWWDIAALNIIPGHIGFWT